MTARRGSATVLAMRLSTLRVAEPCHADWDAMSGDARSRHCEHCQLSVTDLSALTRGEAEALLARGGPDGRVCVRFTRDAAGRIVTRTTELDDLITELQQRLGLPPPQVHPFVTMGVSRTMGVPLEQTEWSVELVDQGADKIAVIKAVRELLGLGLLETKRLVESAPVLLREWVSRDEAEAFAARLRAAGATVRIR